MENDEIIQTRRNTTIVYVDGFEMRKKSGANETG